MGLLNPLIFTFGFVNVVENHHLHKSKVSMTMMADWGCSILGKHAICDKPVECCDGNMTCDT